jgi:hypothetical protein
MGNARVGNTARLDHVREFAEAWDDPRNTRYVMPPIDVNAVLAAEYRTGEPVAFTRDMVWDVEVRKARRPGRYIPWVVAEGSDDAWGGEDVFVRRSRQRLWLEPDRYGLVLEQTHLDHERQVVTFIGAAELPAPDGTLLRAGTGQPIFHVEHGVAGPPDRPLNTWRIVLLTDEPDPRLVEVFTRFAARPGLPEFFEVYLREDRGINVERS